MVRSCWLALEFSTLEEGSDEDGGGNQGTSHGEKMSELGAPESSGLRINFPSSH